MQYCNHRVKQAKKLLKSDDKFGEKKDTGKISRTKIRDKDIAHFTEFVLKNHSQV